MVDSTSTQIGTGITTPWPAPEYVAWPLAAEPCSVVIVDEMDDSCRAILRHHCANSGIYDVTDGSKPRAVRTN